MAFQSSYQRHGIPITVTSGDKEGLEVIAGPLKPKILLKARQVFRSPNFEYTSYTNIIRPWPTKETKHNHATFRSVYNTSACILQIGWVIDGKRQAARFFAGPMTLAETVWDAYMERLLGKSAEWLAEVDDVDELMAHRIRCGP